MSTWAHVRSLRLSHQALTNLRSRYPSRRSWWVTSTTFWCSHPSHCPIGRNFCWTRSVLKETWRTSWCVPTTSPCSAALKSFSGIWRQYTRYVHTHTHCCFIYLVHLIQASGLFQACRLGQHRPICKDHADGIVTVKSASAKPQSEQPLSDWFFKMCNNISNDSLTKLKLYAQVCRHDLGRFRRLPFRFPAPFHKWLLAFKRLLLCLIIESGGVFFS